TDTYALTASTDATFATTTLPAGWSVQCFLDNGDGVRNAGDTLITTDTGNVLANSSVRIFAEVTVPANATIGTQDIYFRAQSTTTSTILDRLHDAVTVAVQAPRLLTLQPNNTGQVFPGGTVVYQHTLSNTGSETEVGPGPNTSTISL